MNPLWNWRSPHWTASVSLGLYDLDIIGRPPQGPFTKLAPSPTATYPALWNHNAKKETGVVCLPDSQLQVRPRMEAKAATVWETRSRAHLNRDFRFNSQPLTVAFTDQESIGGRAWPNMRFNDAQFDYAFSLWGNSTLGLLSFWQHANRQVAGRGTTSIRSADYLPVLDFRELSDDQLVMAELIFDEFRDKELKTRLPRRHRSQPRPARPPRYLRPAGFRQYRVRSRPPPRRQMVRRTLRPRRQTTAQQHHAHHLAVKRISRHRSTAFAIQELFVLSSNFALMSFLGNRICVIPSMLLNSSHPLSSRTMARSKPSRP